MAINVAIYEGRIKFPPSITETRNGKYKVQFKIGVARPILNNSYAQEDDIDCFYFTSDAQNCAKYLLVNKTVIVSGVSEVAKWQDQSTKKWNYKYQLLVKDLLIANRIDSIMGADIVESVPTESDIKIMDDLVDVDADLPF